MKKWIITNENVGELDVTYSAELYEGEKDIEGNPINGISEVKVQVKGEGVDIERHYLSTGQFRPSATASRLTQDENDAILKTVNDLFFEYGIA